MIKRKLLYLVVLLMSTISAAAQQTVGEWYFFPRFLGTVDAIADTPEKVYYTSGQRLFSYDKNSNETYTYSTQNRLNDINVSLIKYSPEHKCLIVTYDNGNIDLLYDNDRTVNMSDIKDASILTGKAIRSINFDGDRAYMSTDFGFVTYDLARHEVVESSNFGFPVECIERVGDFLFLYYLDNGPHFTYSLVSAPHNTIDKFVDFAGMRMKWMKAVDSGIIYADNTDNVRRIVFAAVTGVSRPAVAVNEAVGISGAKGLYEGKDGSYIITGDRIVAIDEKGNPRETVMLPSVLDGQMVSSWNGPKSVWGADADGIANYDISGDTPVVLADKSKPVGVATDEVFFQHWDSKGRLWTGNLGPTQFKGGRKGDYTEVIQRTTRLVGDEPEDMSLMDATVIDWMSNNAQKTGNHTRLVGGVTDFAVDPVNPDRYYQAANIEGLYVIENNEQIHVFNQNNSPFLGNWGARVMSVQIDHDNNLWVGCFNDGKSDYAWYILPAEKLRGDITAVAPSDWRPTKLTEPADKDMGLVICRRSPAVFSFSSRWGEPLRALKTNNTLSNPNDDQMIDFSGIVDQDSKPYSPDRWVCGVEDQRGRVWFGTTMGVVEITNPRDISGTTRLNRIKVPRNDGTNYADYLCETDIVYDIAVDASNRKWIATDASGVFLVSENGDKILENFTKDNSPLPDNCVVSVSCDPNSNKVYFGLLSGLVTYNSDSSPSAEDFSEVYAYPNPVRPEYTGWITITNLMDNSLVKIADAAGHVFHQGRSEGGMYTWDGLDASGNRVKSGVYFVYASQGGDGTSSKGAVTKIVVVN
ncbi:MAG: hypothetical protein K2K84_00685 [Muribaculaceae bacterium]|nr:hypothetical protein [Muribaculaceae bacterium]